jgi:hypothetical protein
MHRIDIDYARQSLTAAAEWQAQCMVGRSGRRHIPRKDFETWLPNFFAGAIAALLLAGAAPALAQADGRLIYHDTTYRVEGVQLGTETWDCQLQHPASSGQAGDGYIFAVSAGGVFVATSRKLRASERQ